MDFRLSDEQRLLEDSVQRFVREEYSLEQRRRLAAREPGYSEQHWQRMAELGWLGASVPQEYGGSGGGPVEVMVLMEAFGAGLVLEPYFPSVVLGANLVLLAGAEAQRRELLPALAGGEHKLAFACAEPQSGFDLFDIETTARARDGGYVLDGHKAVVLGAPTAHTLLVSARSAGAARDRDGIGLFLVPREARGVTLRPYPTVDGLRAAEVTLTGVAVGAGAVLGDAGGALPVIEAVAARAIAALCAEATGAMAASVEATREHLRSREQFGRPIGSFQALQHQFVDMLIALEESRSMTILATLRAGDADAAQRTRATSGAKHLVGRHGRLIGQRAVQLHGGMGVTDDMAVGHWFKRLTMIDVMFGDHAWHLRRHAAASP